jgi:hypothetical protein
MLHLTWDILYSSVFQQMKSNPLCQTESSVQNMNQSLSADAGSRSLTQPDKTEDKPRELDNTVRRRLETFALPQHSNKRLLSLLINESSVIAASDQQVTDIYGFLRLRKRSEPMIRKR